MVPLDLWASAGTARIAAAEPPASAVTPTATRAARQTRCHTRPGCAAACELIAEEPNQSVLCRTSQAWPRRTARPGQPPTVQPPTVSDRSANREDELHGEGLGAGCRGVEVTTSFERCHDVIRADCEL